MATLSFPSPTQLKNISNPSTASDAATKDYVDSQITGGSAVAAAAGSNTYIQYNNAGTLGANSNFTFNSATSILTVTGNIVASNANLGNLVTSNYFSGNGSSLTGLTLNNSQFTDVTVTSPSTGQILSYNGAYWTNINNVGSVSAGPGVDFWFSTPIINTQNANSDIQIDSLSTSPNTAAQTYANVTINGTAALAGFVSGSLGRTVFDAGNWDFSIWANISATGGTNTINCGVHQVLPNAGTVTITGTGTSRTVTASSGTPFATVVAGSDVLLSSYIQTSLGMYRVTAKSSNTVVTINTPSTYTNQTAVAASVWVPLFNVGSATLTSTSFTEYLFGTTQPEFSVTTDSAIGVLLTATTSNSKSIYVTINGTTQASHFTTPLGILHDQLAGLQGGSASQYYHLTSSEYTGTGTGTFVRTDSPTISNLSITGNSTATGNISASYFLGNGSQLTGVTASSATTAGTVTTAAQPNITSVGTLTSLTVSGNVDFYGANVSLGSISNLHITGGSANYVLKTDGTGNLSWTAQSVGTLSADVDEFTGDGSNVAFTLANTPAGENFTMVAVQGVLQPKTSYSLSGNVLTFSSAPPDTAVIEVTTFGGSVVSGGGGGSSALTWNIASSNATMSANNGYFVDTSSAAKTMTLPTSATLGDTIRINDLAGTFSTNNLTVARNGHKIQGIADNLLVDADQSSFGLVYSNSTYGWKVLEL